MKNISQAPYSLKEVTIELNASIKAINEPNFTPIDFQNGISLSAVCNKVNLVANHLKISLMNFNNNLSGAAINTQSIKDVIISKGLISEKDFEKLIDNEMKIV